ncbi:cell division protein FtsA [Sphingomicrobium sediminis]|uniref:Cell division protein FtsA n=1 Tax=Sphingomicrobium sediminis TaxID=2950949 RepID=A0A9X2J4T8_9SPHN|nr:cell division protein FtsA [Sphingomicrobium sediminis]MCM8557562.1 cell division protein FtsA [Sphingomicrobium sediminis]
MAAPDGKLIAALDIGSSKVATLIARVGEDGELDIVGSGQRESRGVKRGSISDRDLSETAVRETLDLAERMSGVTVNDVWAGFASGGLMSDVANVEVELGGQQVEDGDVAQLLSAGQGAIERDGQVVLHAQPALYTLDGVEGVKNPRGLHADKLGVDIHVIAAQEAPLRNLDYVIRAAHLGVGAIIAAPLASARACLSKDERDLGVALVELGADVTTIGVHVGGMLVGLRTIPIGARDISEDIAMAFGVTRRDAERMKCFYGSAIQSPSDNQAMIDAEIGEHGEPARITRAQLVTVIRQRVEELANEIDAGLKGLGFGGPAKRQVVLTGGGAELKNIDDYLQGVLGHRVRIGRPIKLPGMPEAQAGPAFSTLTGLLLLGAEDDGASEQDLALGSLRRRRGDSIIARLFQALKGA